MQMGPLMGEGRGHRHRHRVTGTLCTWALSARAPVRALPTTRPVAFSRAAAPGRGRGSCAVAGTSASFAPRAPFAITGASPAATLDYLRDNTARSNQDNPGINPER
jgi:hypothetical protein